MAKGEYSISFTNENENLTISCDYFWELNISIEEKVLRDVIQNIKNANWDTRGSIQAGKCLESDVFWSYQSNDMISILIGQDDEAWTIGFLLPYKIIKNVFVD